VFGVPNSENDQGKNNNNVATTPIGNFYVQLSLFLKGTPMTDLHYVYELPGGAISLTDLGPPAGAPPGYNMFNTPGYPDGAGGAYLEGTFELTVAAATGIYRQFEGGHDHMVDRLHVLPARPGQAPQFDEFCFCNFSQYPFP
jgi:hypothetical protein